MELILFAKHVPFIYMLYNNMFYGCNSILYLGYYCRMVYGMRSSIRGHSLGYGRGRNISVHESIHEVINHEEGREKHVSEH